MLKHSICLLTVVCLFGLVSNVRAQERSGNAQAQQPQAAQQSASAVVAEPEAPRVTVQAEGQVSVLRLMKFSGLLRDRAGNARTGAVGLTFALYKDQQGGSPLWLEVQNAQLDEQGRYTVLLGSTKNEGLPLELFSSGEARWLGVQVQLPGEEEQARVLLVSVPYALKAADAETLGGKPPSAFLLADPVGADPRVRPEAGKEAVKERPERPMVISGTVGKIAKFVGPNPDDVGDSSITETGGGLVGLGTATPGAKLSLGTDLGNTKLALYDGGGDQYGMGVQPGQLRLHVGNAGARFSFLSAAAGAELLTLTGLGRLGIGAATPGAKLSLGTDLADTKLALYDGGDKYGFGIQPGQFRLHVGNSGARFAFLSSVAGTELVTIQGTGNVGVGTAAPAEKLDVNGNIKISGPTSNGLVFADGTTQTSAATGDITGVVASIGLIGGATSGVATLELSGGVWAGKQF